MYCKTKQKKTCFSQGHEPDGIGLSSSLVGVQGLKRSCVPRTSFVIFIQPIKPILQQL